MDDSRSDDKEYIRRLEAKLRALEVEPPRHPMADPGMAVKVVPTKMVVKSTTQLLKKALKGS